MAYNDMPLAGKKQRRLEYIPETGRFMDLDTGEELDSNGTPVGFPSIAPDYNPISPIDMPSDGGLMPRIQQGISDIGELISTPHFKAPMEQQWNEAMEPVNDWLTSSPGTTTKPVYSNDTYLDSRQPEWSDLLKRGVDPLSQPYQTGTENVAAPSRMDRGLAIGAELLENPIVEAIGTTPALQTVRSAGQALKAAPGAMQEAARLTSDIPFGQSIKEVGDDLVDDVTGQMAFRGMPDEVLPSIDEALDGSKERGFAETVRTSDVTPQPIRDELTRHPRVYDPITNADTVTAANNLLDTDMAKVKFALLDSNDTPDAVTTVAGELLARRLIASVETQDEGLRILDKLMEKATTAGQSIQALSIYGRLTPEGILMHAQRTVKLAQKEFPNLKMSPKQYDEFAKRAEALQLMDEGREKIMSSAELLRDVSKMVPRSKLSAISSLQTIMQLANPKTLIRNVIGNAGFNALENISRLVAVGADLPVSMITGQRSTMLPDIGRQVKAGYKGAGQAIEETRRNVNLRGMDTQLDLQTGQGYQNLGPRFQDSSVPGLAGAEQALSFGLRVPDRAFYEAAFEDGLWNWARATGKNEGKDAFELFANPTKEGLDIAHHAGLVRTFQDENLVSNAFAGIKRQLNLGKDFGIGDMILKYPRTPANLLVRGVSYTPMAFVSTVLDIGRVLAGKQVNQAAFVETIGRATVGTVGLTATGYILAKQGILTGGPSKDKDIRAMEKESGLRNHSVNLSSLKRWIFSAFSPVEAKAKQGDVWMNYDWALPLSIPVSMGAAAGLPKSQKLGKNEATGVWDKLSETMFAQLGTTVDAGAAALDILATQPLMQGVKRLFGGASLTESAVTMLAQVPASFAPTLLSQLNQVMDNTVRETYRPDVLDEALTTVMAKIPGLSAMLPERLNVYGEPAQRYQNDTNNPINVFLNPAFISEYLPTSTAEMVMELYKSTGETAQFPRVAPKIISVNGRSYELTTEQMVEYQGLLGKETNKAFGALAESGLFKEATPENKVKFLARVLEQVNIQSKELLHERYSEASGAVSPLPKSKEGVSRLGKTMLTDAKQAYTYHEALELYDGVGEKIQANNVNFARAVRAVEELPDGSKERIIKERSLYYQTYKKALEAAHLKLRRNNKDVNKALIEIRGSNMPKLKAPTMDGMATMAEMPTMQTMR